MGVASAPSAALCMQAFVPSERFVGLKTDLQLVCVPVIRVCPRDSSVCHDYCCGGGAQAASGASTKILHSGSRLLLCWASSNNLARSLPL